VNLSEMFKKLEEDIFAYEVSGIPVRVSELMTNIVNRQAFDLGDAKKLLEFNRIMQASLEAIQNKDYLLLADIITYRLEPMLSSGYKN